MLHETTDDQVNATAGPAELDQSGQPVEVTPPLEAVSPFPLALEPTPPPAVTPAPATQTPAPMEAAPTEAAPPFPLATVDVASPPVEAISPFPLAAPEAPPSNASPPGPPAATAAGTIDVARSARPMLAEFALPSVEAGPSVQIALPAEAADPNEDVETPAPVEIAVAVSESVPAEAALSHLMARWVADGDRTTEKWMVDGDSVAETPDEEGAATHGDFRFQPVRWLQSPDGRRFAPLLLGAVLASVAIVAIARTYSHPRPALERAEAAVTAVAPPPPAAAPASATVPHTAHLAMTARPVAPAGSGHRPQVAAQAPRRGPAARATTKGDLRVCRTAIRKGRVAHDELAACRAAVEVTPTSAPAVLLLARATYLAGRQRDSLQLARRATAIDPRFPDPYLLIGDVEQTAGHPRDARAAFEAYLRLAPRGRHAAETRTVLSRL